MMRMIFLRLFIILVSYLRLATNGYAAGVEVKCYEGAGRHEIKTLELSKFFDAQVDIEVNRTKYRNIQPQDTITIYTSRDGKRILKAENTGRHLKFYVDVENAQSRIPGSNIYKASISDRSGTGTYLRLTLDRWYSISSVFRVRKKTKDFEIRLGERTPTEAERRRLDEAQIVKRFEQEGPDNEWDRKLSASLDDFMKESSFSRQRSISEVRNLLGFLSGLPGEKNEDRRNKLNNWLVQLYLKDPTVKSVVPADVEESIRKVIADKDLSAITQDTLRETEDPIVFAYSNKNGKKFVNFMSVADLPGLPYQSFDGQSGTSYSDDRLINPLVRDAKTTWYYPVKAIVKAAAP